VVPLSQMPHLNGISGFDISDDFFDIFAQIGSVGLVSHPQ
jgi:hypothetical protein